MNFAFKSVIFTLFMAFCFSTYAGKPHKDDGCNDGLCSSSKEIQECKITDVQVSTIKLLDGESAAIPVQYDASNCAGAFKGNNSAFEKPTVNLGYDNDGWLNKEDYNDWWEGPGAFVDDSDLLDLDGDGNINDPGWILASLGEQETRGMVGQSIPDTDTSEGYTFVDDLITFDSCVDKNNRRTNCFSGEAVAGEWTYTPPDQDPEILRDLIGGDFFDQVAVVFKAGNAFAMYNFNISDLNIDPIFAGDYNFELTGTWDISDVLACHGLSNVSFWLRDPIADTEVPEPSTLGLLLLSSVFIIRRKVLNRKFVYK
jgi:hypothetical protein